MKYKRDLGKLGESWIDVWCSSAGLIANGSAIDKTGWDYYIEFPFLTERNVLQLHAAAVECKVQVKSTDGNRKYESISLSNLRRLVTAQMPAFFVFLEFDGLENVQRTYVVHVDEFIIKSSLKRINEVIQSEGAEKLNKKTLRIKYDDTHLISENNGSCFRDSLISYVKNGMANYLDNKNNILNNVGFDSVVATIKFEVDGRENLECLIDASLGIKTKVNIKNILGRNKRFNIDDANPFVDVNTAILELSDINPYLQGHLNFRSRKINLNVGFTAEMYISSLVQMLPEKSKKFRLSTSFFDLLIYPLANKVDFKIKDIADVYFGLNDQRSFVDFLVALDSGKDQIRFEFLVDEKNYFSGDIGCDYEGFDSLRIKNSIKDVDRILDLFDFRQDIRVSLNGILRNSDSCSKFNTLASLDEVIIKLVIPSADLRLKSGEVVYCLSMSVVAIGDFYFYLVYSFFGPVLVNKDSYEVISNNINLEWKYFHRKGSIFPKKEVNEVIEELDNSTGSDYKLFVMFDINELFGGN